MSRLITDLQIVLAQLTGEHRLLLSQLEAQHRAMMNLDLNAMGALINQQDATRQKIVSLDMKRRTITRQIVVTLKTTGEPTLKRLSELFPPQAPALLKARDELRDVVARISQRTQMSSKLTAAVLGHLNTVMKILAGAVERAGLYTKQGVPRLAARIGAMDAVG